MCNKYIFDYTAGCGCPAKEEIVPCEEAERGQKCKGMGEGNEPGVPQVMKEGLKRNDCKNEAKIAKAMKLVGA
jgi:hypothetical protein